jgi:apolipoprotein N-acyltransferase
MPISATKPFGPLSWKQSFFWLALAVVCFHIAYTSVKYPIAGLFIFGYALGLVRLTHQPTVRRAFYFGLATAFLCYGPQLWFFFKIFSVVAVVLWLVLAFWMGLFTAIICGAIRRWGRVRAVWLIPVVWTGIEYFRSELYYLKFSWLNIGYAWPPFLMHICPFDFGMYGWGFAILGVIIAGLYYPEAIAEQSRGRTALANAVFVAALLIILAALLISSFAKVKIRGPKPVSIVGIQMEFPPENVIPKMLDKALAKNTNADIFVLSEYTLHGPVPNNLKDWCREHSRYLVVGGEDPAGTTNYYDTAFVVGTNGDIVFKQGKCVPIQFFKDGLPAPEQKVWDSPWGKIGFCVCYDLSYTRVTDELIRQGAGLLIVPTMDVEDWSRHEHELHTRVAPVRAAEYGVPIFRLASSGISQAVDAEGTVVAQAPMPGNGDILAVKLWLVSASSLPLDRYLAPSCTAVTAVLIGFLLLWTVRDARQAKQRFARQ